ncbi:MAG: DUF1820 family protein [Gammaproteobacteria bacterium]|nr:DUF1820 family protein [Gammaproteobacteria bacterium]MDH3767388.1 DUF1820 family protein [Gammaproteobacteria bacterium]
MAEKKLYRITFHSQGKIYEIYARKVTDAGLLGFVQVEDLVFGERGGLVVDPSEERIRDEFAGVSKTFLPMQTVIRIDQVDRQGVSKISDGGSSNVSQFPMPVFPSGDGKK